MEVQAIEIPTCDSVEFAFADDFQIPFEHSPEGIKYDPYKIPSPHGCGGKFDGFG